MLPVYTLRSSLAEIGALDELPPDETHRGELDGATSNLWEGLDDDGPAIMADAVPHQSDNPEPDEGETGHGSSSLEAFFEIPPDLEEERVRDAMGGEAGESIRSAIEVNGVDALGWYVTYHAIGPQWGIYIKTSALQYLATQVFHELETDWATKLKLAFRAIHREVSATVLDRPCYAGRGGGSIA